MPFLGPDPLISDVLNKFPAGSEIANIARLLLALTMFLTYPMESFVARHVFVMLIYDGDMDAAKVDQVHQVLSPRRMMTRWNQTR